MQKKNVPARLDKNRDCKPLSRLIVKGKDPYPGECKLRVADTYRDDSGADIPLCDESFSIYTTEE